MKHARVVLVGSVVTAMAAAGALAGAVPASAASVATGTGTQSVIVLLKDQLATTPADAAHVSSRRTGARRAQDAVLGRLGGSVKNLVNYTVGNAFSATVTQAQATALASDPAVAGVVPNERVQLAPTVSPPASGVSQKARVAASAAPVDPGACSSDPKKPVLEPEALQTIHARSSDPKAKTAAALGITGAGVKVAFIADGINPANAGFTRSDGRSSIVDYKDFYGDGPNAPTGGAEAFGDASAVSAQGNVVYDVADFSNPSVVSYPGGHCYIKIVGVAPGSDVVALKAGSELLPNSAILQAIDYAVSVDHVNVLNQSFGANLLPDAGARNTIELFDQQAVKAGVTVVTSTGDAGITSTIGNPATDPAVISTGATTDSRLYEQTGYALATRFGNGKWLDNNISSLSSAGITQSGRTIDVSAPGEADWAVCDAGENFSCASFGNPTHPSAAIQSFGGTSQSAPITAGVAALVIQAYRSKHGGTSPTPAVVKRIITSTSRDLGLPGEQQGSGVIDARAAVEAALTWPGASSSSAAVSSNIALSANQLTLSGAPGTSKTASVTVTNVGRTPLKVAASTRRFLTLSHATQSTALSTSSPDTTPYPTTGAPWVYKKLTFAVPTGADELASTIRWQSGAVPGGAGPVVRLSLFTPDGTYAANTRPQGGASPADYGLATVRHPAAGTWTAVLYTPATGGFTGSVSLDNQTYRAVPVGSVSAPSKALAPGAHGTVKVTLPIPAVGGDDTAAISIGSSDGHQTAVPVVLRAIVRGAFAGTITGGNARAFSPAQTFSYAFDVPAGKKDVDVSVSLADDPGDLLQGALISPQGEVVSVNSNASLTAAGDETQGLSLRNVAASPTAGRWRYVLTVENPVSGKELTEGFTGSVTFNQVRVSGFSVPASLPAGVATPVRVSVSNTGPAPMLVQTDARTGALRATQLAPQFAGSTLTLPQSVDDLSQIPAFLVPPNTSKLAVTASTTVPAQVELSNPGGGIDVFGDLQSAKKGSTLSTASVSESTGSLGLGYWGIYVQEIGPFGDGGAPAATSVLSATAQTKAFDSAVTSSTGDPFVATVDPSADPGAPVVIAPGASTTITVTIKPSGARGSQHSGVLNLVTTPIGVADSFNTTGEVLATLPYSYKIS